MVKLALFKIGDLGVVKAQVKGESGYWLRVVDRLCSGSESTHGAKVAWGGDLAGIVVG
jgi:hypothetical protein